MNRIAYQYDAHNIYMGETVCNVVGGPPYNATLMPPVISDEELSQTGIKNGENLEPYIPVWDDGVWRPVLDYRGRMGYVNGQEFIMEDLGDLPTGFSDNMPPPSLAGAKEFQKSVINYERHELEECGFIFDGSTFDTDEKSVLRLLGASQMAQNSLTTGIPFEIEWTLQDNSVRTLSARDVIDIVTAFAKYSSLLHEKARILKTQVDEAKNVNDILVIDFSQYKAIDFSEYKRS